MHCVSWKACLMLLSSVSRFPTGIGAILWVWIFVAYILYHILMFPWFHLFFMTFTCQLIKSSCFYTQSLSHIFNFFSNPTNHDQVNAASLWLSSLITCFYVVSCTNNIQVSVCMCMCLCECAFVLCECCIHLCPCICFLRSGPCVCLCVKV